MPVIIHQTNTQALFDTGAGLSTVDSEFIKKNPAQFKFIKNISNGADATGKIIPLKLYKVKKIQVGNLIFKNEYVLAMNFDVVREYISKDVHFIIGFNLITKANWHFDIRTRSWAVD